MEDGQRSGVGRQVQVVLPRTGPGRPPLVEAVQRGAHGAHRLVEDLEQLNLVHGSRTILAIGAMPAIRLIPLWQPSMSPVTWQT